MSYIYAPKGRAKEYADLALNLFQGCPHGCTYCYVPDMPPWRFMADGRERFHEKAKPRYEVIAALEKEAPKFKGKEVFLCFTSDPYPPEDPDMMARQAIKILHRHGVKVRILTKGGAHSVRDFDLLTINPGLSSFGTTLVFWREKDARTWEPKAAPPEERRAAVERAHSLGIPTWLSLEPIIEPWQTLKIIHDTAEHVDMFKLGRWNHDPRADKIDYRAFLKEAIPLLEGLGKQYYIKKDLAVYL